MSVDSNDSPASSVSNASTASLGQNSVGRREFLAAGSAVGLSASFFNRSVHAQGSDIIKVGLVGAGGRGTGAAKDEMAADPGCRMTATSDLTVAPLEGSNYQL